MNRFFYITWNRNRIIHLKYRVYYLKYNPSTWWQVLEVQSNCKRDTERSCSHILKCEESNSVLLGPSDSGNSSNFYDDIIFDTKPAETLVAIPILWIKIWTKTRMILGVDDSIFSDWIMGLRNTVSQQKLIILTYNSSYFVSGV